MFLDIVQKVSVCLEDFSDVQEDNSNVALEVNEWQGVELNDTELNEVFSETGKRLLVTQTPTLLMVFSRWKEAWKESAITCKTPT